MIGVEIYEAGEEIIQQGSMERSVYVLEEGLVEVIKSDIILDEVGKPGSVFGEVGCILNRPRTATVRAKVATRVRKYGNIDIQDFVQSNPDVAVKMLEDLAARLEASNLKLLATL